MVVGDGVVCDLMEGVAGICVELAVAVEEAGRSAAAVATSVGLAVLVEAAAVEAAAVGEAVS